MEHITPLRALEHWYASMCNGDWEHTYGVRIETLDNPGWTVDIDLLETPLAAARLDRVTIDRTGDDWVQYWAEDGIFKGRGGARNLTEILQCFAEWKALHECEGAF
jgi:hypothetical protein